jgi:hypothetical protein
VQLLLLPAASAQAQRCFGLEATLAPPTKARVAPALSTIRAVQNKFKNDFLKSHFEEYAWMYAYQE